MNIFATNINPLISAKEHCDKHLVKQIAESMQIIATTHFILDNVNIGIKSTHHNHPCTIWARESFNNYMWLVDFTAYLLMEYTKRYDKIHQYQSIFDSLPSINNIDLDKPLSPFANVTGDFQNHSDDVCENYKAYLSSKFKTWATREDKRKIFVKWTNREVPSWVK